VSRLASDVDHLIEHKRPTACVSYHSLGPSGEMESPDVRSPHPYATSVGSTAHFGGSLPERKRLRVRR
jgi:hypothetical protein